VLSPFPRPDKSAIGAILMPTPDPDRTRQPGFFRMNGSLTCGFLPGPLNGAVTC
jgi:hypothetical protein